MLYSAENIESIRVANQAVRDALDAVGDLVAPDVTTAELNAAVEEVLRAGAEFLFAGQRMPNVSTPFPSAACISVNEEIVHGVPGDRRLAEGDVVSVDCGARIAGWCGDSARTWAVGRVDGLSRRLIEATREALDVAIAEIRPGLRWSRVAMLIQGRAERAGFGVVRDFCGHGVGRELHESPSVPNHADGFGRRRMPDFTLEPGLVIAIEPMFTAGTYRVMQALPGAWPVVTRDGKRSAHFEHTVAVTDSGADVLSG